MLVDMEKVGCGEQVDDDVGRKMVQAIGRLVLKEASTQRGG
jgi:hypothetical protein